MKIAARNLERGWKMKYHDSVEKSAEYLRCALPLMAKQGAAMHPVSYAVWYEYVAGSNAALRAAVDAQLKVRTSLDETITQDIFQRHVAAIDEQVAQRIGESFSKVMADVSSSAARVGDQAGEFGNALEKWCTERAMADSATGPDIDAILHLTRTMQNTIVALKDRLDESRDEIEQLRREVLRAREDALVDGLTGLTNRRGFEQAIAECLAAAGTSACGPSLLMADIDFFKRVNDNYGHLFGDKIIQAVAQILKGNVKGKDTAARYGGEEFVVLLPDTPIDGAGQLAEQIRAIVERGRIKRATDAGPVANITISLGVASFRRGESAADFVARADAALYVSKSAGRNRVTLAPD